VKRRIVAWSTRRSTVAMALDGKRCFQWKAGVGGEDDGRLAIPGGDDAVEVVGGLLVEAAGVPELVEEQHLRLWRSDGARA